MEKKHKLGLALGGGGARGFAHIGTFQLLEEHDIKPEIIVGTSAGALMGVLFADGFKSEEIKEMFHKREVYEFASLQLPQMGLFDSTKFHQFLKHNMRTKKIEDLQTPTIVMTTDLDHGEAKAFTHGPIAEIVTASCSVPILFNPVKIDGTYYVDGGIFHNFPVSIIRNDCNTVIGSNVSPVIPDKYKKTLLGIAEKSYHFLFKANTDKDREICDILIETEEFGKYKMFDLKNVDLIAQIGYDAAINAFENYIIEKPESELANIYQSKSKKQTTT